jgi:hypothetical protein
MRSTTKKEPEKKSMPLAASKTYRYIRRLAIKTHLDLSTFPLPLCYGHFVMAAFFTGVPEPFWSMLRSAPVMASCISQHPPKGEQIAPTAR